MVLNDTNTYVEDDGEKLFTGGHTAGASREVAKREIIYVYYGEKV